LSSLELLNRSPTFLTGLEPLKSLAYWCVSPALMGPFINFLGKAGKFLKNFGLICSAASIILGLFF
jgi:hypothetical protein